MSFWCENFSLSDSEDVWSPSQIKEKTETKENRRISNVKEQKNIRNKKNTQWEWVKTTESYPRVSGSESRTWAFWSPYRTWESVSRTWGSGRGWTSSHCVSWLPWREGGGLMWRQKLQRTQWNQDFPGSERASAWSVLSEVYWC